MPLVEMSLWQGVKEDIKIKLISEVTDVVSHVIGCPKEAVHMLIHEIPKENWATGGNQHSKKFK